MGFKHFKSDQQAKVALAVAQRNADLLIVLPTGGGKSVVSLLPSLIEPSYITVVIVPLVSLRIQFMQICTSFGITCHLWKDDLETPQAPGVVLVAAENAAKASFRSFLLLLSNLERLARVVIDECHLVVAHSCFRNCFRKIHLLREAPVPFVFMSATVPVSLENELRVTFASPFTSIRFCSVVWNAYYSVCSESLKKTAFETLYTRLNIAVNHGAAVIFCQSKQDTSWIAGCLKEKGLECETYTSEKDDQARESTVAKISNSSLRIVAATSALSAGVDLKGIDHVFHFGRPYTLLDYGQECGRGGRNSEKVTCCVFTWPGDDTNDDQGVKLLISGEVCRRAVLSSYLDETASYCYQSPKAVLCDICERLSAHHDTQQKRAISSPLVELQTEPKKQKLHEPLTLAKLHFELSDTEETEELFAFDHQVNNHSEQSCDLLPKVAFEEPAQPSQDVTLRKDDEPTFKSTQTSITNEKTDYLRRKPPHNGLKHNLLISSQPSEDIHLNETLKSISKRASMHPLAARKQLDLKSAKQIVQEQIEILKQMKKRSCLLCVALGKGVHRHEYPNCTYTNPKPEPGKFVQKRCLRCLSTDHNRSQGCPFRRINGCFVCALPFEASDVKIASKFGLQCDSGLKEIVLPLSWLIWRTPKLKETCKDFIGCGTTVEDADFFQWMMEVTSTGLTNAVQLVVCAEKAGVFKNKVK
jgi:superfamily II DNA helicase RecQ